MLPAILLLLSAKTTPWRAYVAILVGFAIGIALTLAVNAARYGSPLITGYGDEGWTNPLVVGLRGILISPGRGIIWAFPATLLAPLGLWHLWRSGHRQATMAFGGLIAAQSLNVALWHSWWGGWNWGPRLLVPALPLIATLCAVGLTRLRAQWRTPLAAALLVSGTFWALPGVFTNLFGGYAGTFDSTDTSFQLRAYPPFGAWSFLQRWRASTLGDANAADILWLRTTRSTGNLSLLPTVCLLALACALAFRALRGHPDIPTPTGHGTTQRPAHLDAVSDEAAA